MNKIVSVLLIEDDEDDYLLTRDNLEHVQQQRFAVTWVTRGSEALSAINQQAFDLCLLDYRLGAETALDVMDLFKRKKIDVPVVVLSGQADPEIDEQVMRAGATDYLTKDDIESPKFLRALRYALARREADDARFQRNQIALQNQAKDRFLAHLGHELRTPLTSILGYTELLLSETRSFGVREELGIIQSNGKHLLSLLNDLLDMSKIIANKFELNTRDIPLSPFLTDVYALMKIAARDKGLSLTVNATTPLPVTVSIDATRLRQVLLNLISNAIKFTEQGSVQLSVSVQAQGNAQATNPARLVFSVRDTGKGIATQDLSKVFRPFEQVEAVSGEERAGTGLGLSICQEIVKRMRGEMSVSSKLGDGSEFSFWLPLSDEEVVLTEPFNLKNLAVEQDEIAPDILVGRVLVVDDLAELRRLTGHMLMRSGVTVEYAENGRAALSAMEAFSDEGNPFDLVLMDIHMPVMDGIQAVRMARKAGLTTPVVALTAANHKGLTEELTLVGFDGVISKPVDNTELLAVTSQYLVSRINAVPNHGDSQNSLFERPQILVVEDDKDAAALMSILLETCGARVTLAHDGASAATLWHNQGDKEFDHVILDLTLPDVSGFEMAEKIREQSAEVPITIISGHEPDPAICKRLAISKTLLKPVTRADLEYLLKR